ncbi:hypothetical protein ACKI16_46335, partial [Streptomyces scabiei]|uniref:hypothetical protein n=1 Tax=Streptomyces scabiei TaxID=1930 RepID=UPI0038F762CF
LITRINNKFKKTSNLINKNKDKYIRNDILIYSINDGILYFIHDNKLIEINNISDLTYYILFINNNYNASNEASYQKLNKDYEKALQNAEKYNKN